jgi:hypothetical protein
VKGEDEVLALLAEELRVRTQGRLNSGSESPGPGPSLTHGSTFLWLTHSWVSPPLMETASCGIVPFLQVEEQESWKEK